MTAQALDYDDWLAQPARHPHDAADQGMHVFKPEPPLSIIDPGIEPYVGSTMWLQTHRQSETKFTAAEDATGLQRFGTLSGAWVLQVLGRCSSSSWASTPLPASASRERCDRS